MKKLLVVTAIIEDGTGVALLVDPALVVKLLLGTEISGASISLGRVTGIALAALGVACWLARSDIKSSAAKGLGVAMLIYNIGTVIILGQAGIQSQMVGVVLWPAVIVHLIMAIWGFRCLHALNKA